MPANTAHLKQSFAVPLILTTALRICIQSGSGTNALALNGSRCHNDSCKETKFENTQSETLCSYTSMKFYRRSTSLRGGGASTYAATISDVSVSGYYSRINRFVENNVNCYLELVCTMILLEIHHCWFENSYSLF